MSANYIPSICSDCFHRKVCKWTDRVKEIENKRPEIIDESGIVIQLKANCKFKHSDQTKINE